jgi:phage gp45-like
MSEEEIGNKFKKNFFKNFNNETVIIEEDDIDIIICKKHNISQEFAEKYLFQEDESPVKIKNTTMVRINNKYLKNILTAQADLRVNGNGTIKITKTINALLKDKLIDLKNDSI